MPDLTLWTIRLSAVFYLAALSAWLLAHPRPARIFWTAGCILYLGHPVSAFHFHHHWSHSAAYQETARQTEALFGVASGSGIYWNYIFTLLWALDVLCLWTVFHPRPRWISVSLHAFFAFMFFNGLIVFGKGLTRSLSVIAAICLLTLAFGLRWRQRLQ